MAGRHARDYYEASAPPHGQQSATDLPTTELAVRRVGRPRAVPTFTMRSIGQGGAQLYPGSIATATPQTFTVASPPPELSGFGVKTPPSRARASRTAHRPISARLEPASLLRSVHHWFAFAAPSDLARQARTVWQCQHVPPSSGPLATLTGVPRLRLPPASIRPLRRPNGSGLSPPLESHGASWRTVPPRRKPTPTARSRSPAAARGCPAPTA